ncbi:MULTISPECIES: Maf family protein [Pacificibacter]|uniref:Maf family protein n=1 Tax=Pacificibacter TaxID=1042323 RepID=UPI001C081B3D|nr:MULTISPECIES: Maf family nucleotide pyrophosphatase [Pacificibacter]MBU2936152.1 septum formation protein Maf [Pacificibacter marinus]MDO6614998.1 Maf family nucleotide pyrophosphatase [Pacificibacter sp. 1_MG-2023]
MTKTLILASGSSIRQTLLANAKVSFDVNVPRIDEESIKDALLAEGTPPRDIADALAEGKARKISMKMPEAVVLGCDQVLSFRGRLFSKPTTPDDAREQLTELNGERHKLLSAAVIYEGGEPKWRHIGEVKLQMKQNSDAYLDDYVTRNWNSIRHSVGGYKLEEEGVRLFSRIDGDHFNVLGLPLLEILGYFGQTGVISS